MQRVTLSIDETLGAEFDDMVRARGYQSRSEAVRDLVREATEAWRGETLASSQCVANLSYIYQRETRSLASRLLELRHEHHDLVVSALQTPLDHDHTLESVILRGEAGVVRAFADRVRAERGVRFGALNLVSVEAHDHHDDPASHRHAGHVHLSPLPG